jgi:hypothetical protein
MSHTGSSSTAKIGLFAARVQIATGIPTGEGARSEMDRSGVCTCLCRTLRPAGSGEVGPREPGQQDAPGDRGAAGIAAGADGLASRLDPVDRSA